MNQNNKTFPTYDDQKSTRFNKAAVIHNDRNNEACQSFEY